MLFPILDTSTGAASLPYKTIQQIIIQIHYLLLHDTWYTLHPNDKDYTFSSAPHIKYSSIDYLFLSQKDLPFLSNATIESMLLSDHHPITMTLMLSAVAVHPLGAPPPLSSHLLCVKWIDLCIAQIYTWPL